MFGSRRTEAALMALQAENTDLRAQLRAERAENARERQELLDRLLAATSPGVLREVRRAPAQEPVPHLSPESMRRRLHFPGSGGPARRPPDPPSLPTPGSVPPTDIQSVDALKDVEAS